MEKWKSRQQLVVVVVVVVHSSIRSELCWLGPRSPLILLLLLLLIFFPQKRTKKARPNKNGPGGRGRDGSLVRMRPSVYVTRHDTTQHTVHTRFPGRSQVRKADKTIEPVKKRERRRKKEEKRVEVPRSLAHRSEFYTTLHYLSTTLW